MKTTDTRYCRGDTVKAIGERRFGGYLVRFNPVSGDLHGERFTPETDFVMGNYKIAGQSVLFHHGMDEDIGVIPIGLCDFVEKRPDGLYIEGKLDFVGNVKAYAAGLGKPGDWQKQQEQLAQEYEDHIWRWMQQGKMGFSSGALPQSVYVNPTTKAIERWAIIEPTATLTEADPRRTASELGANIPNSGTEIYTLKSLSPLKAFSDLVKEPVTAIEPVDDADSDKDIPAITTKALETEASTGELKAMTPEDVLALIMATLEKLGIVPQTTPEAPMPPEQAAMQTVAAAVPPEELVKMTDPEEQKAFAAKLAKAGYDVMTARKQKTADLAAGAVDTAQKFAPGKSKTEGAGVVTKTGTNISVGEPLKFARLSAADMQAGYLMLKCSSGLKGRKMGMDQYVSEDYITHMAQKTNQLLTRNQIPNMEDEYAIKAAIPWKANELDASNIATQGDEWVGVTYGSTLWERARALPIYEKILAKGVHNVEVPQGSESAYVLMEGNDPTAFTSRQAQSLDSTGRPESVANIQPFTTDRVLVTPGEIKIATAYTLILEEDSMINVAPQVNTQLTKKAKEVIEFVMINGDTATGANVNINLIDGTPATGLATPDYIVFDGFLKNALVTNTLMSRSAGGAFTLFDYDSTIGLFPTSIQANPQDLLFITDINTGRATRRLLQLLTKDVAGDQATVFTGKVDSVFDVDIFQTGYMHKANSAGKVTAAIDGTLGRIAAIFAPYWAWVWKRNITIKSSEDIFSDTTTYVLSMRMALKARGSTASAVTYNVLV